MSEELENSKKSKKGLFIAILVVVILISLCVIFYLVNVSKYKKVFLPNTFINNVDCSNKKIEELVPDIENELAEYELTLFGRNVYTGEGNEEIGKIRSSEIDLKFIDTYGSLEKLLLEQNEWKWVSAYLNKGIKSFSLTQGVIFDESKLQEVLLSLDALNKENFSKPQDAYIGKYDKTKNSFVINPEKNGSVLDNEKVIHLVYERVLNRAEILDLEEEGCYLEASVKQSDEKLLSSVEEMNHWMDTKITYDWNGNTVVVDKNLIEDWISLNDLNPQIDKTKVAAFVKEQADLYDTFGKNADFVTTLGVEIKVPRKSFGWKTDRDKETDELIEKIKSGSTEDREPIYSYRGRVKGKDDIGNTYLEADATNQHVYLYENGVLIYESDCVTGSLSRSDRAVSPEGVFGVVSKIQNVVLRGKDYEDFVYYWMGYYGNYGMHDATWRDTFGGDIYKTDGSHGCLNLPLDTAEVVYSHIDIGMPVLLYYYEDPFQIKAALKAAQKTQEQK